MTFKIGDKVRANGREAEIVGYDELSDRMAWRVVERGGSNNTYHGHISTTRLEPLDLGDGHIASDDCPCNPEIVQVSGDDESADDLLAALATIDSSPDLTVVPVLAETEDVTE